MPTRRRWPGVAVLDNKIYVTGGHEVVHGGQTMSSVDCYDPNTNTWSQMANMNIARWSHSLVSLQGRLYAIGGDWVDDVEVYDPYSNTLGGRAKLKKYLLSMPMASLGNKKFL